MYIYIYIYFFFFLFCVIFILFQKKESTETKVLLFLATNDLVHFHYDILNIILNGDDNDDMDEREYLQFGHLLNQSVKLLKLQGDMTHKVCISIIRILKNC